MIKRDYVICGAVVRLDGSARRPVWYYATHRSWRVDSGDVLQKFIDSANVEDGWTLEIYSMTRLSRWF